MKQVVLTPVPQLSTINNQYGEIVSGVSTFKCKNVEEFIMCFVNSLRHVVKLDGNTIRVLMFCWQYSTFRPDVVEANIIYNNKILKRYIQDSCPTMSNSVIDRAFSTLVKHGLLKRIGRGTFTLNPQYFFKGTLNDRAKLIAKIEYCLIDMDDNSPTSAAHPTGDDIV